MTEKRKISLIALDLDGTTLKDDKSISRETRNAVWDAVRAGIQVVIASGRSCSSLPESVLSIPGIEYAVTSNGAAVYRLADGACIRRVTLDPAAVDGILRLTEGRTLGIEAFLEGVPYALRAYVEDPLLFGAMPYAVSYIQSTRKPVEDIRKFIKEHRESLDGIDLIVKDEEERGKIRRRLEKSGLPLYLTSSVKNRIETASPEAGKAAALKYLQDMLGISAEETAAFGDADNDIDMLRAAGIGIAVENASPGCREAADYITKSNREDGVAFAIRKILEIPGKGTR